MAEPTNRKKRKGKNGNRSSILPPQEPQLKHWFLTYNNYISGEPEKIERIMREFCTEFKFQEETGAEGTKHLQGSFHLTKPMRPTQFKLGDMAGTPWWKRTNNGEAADAYCCKNETRTGKLFTWPPPLELRNPEFPWEFKILKLLAEKPDYRKVYWFWEEGGCRGKSSFVKWISFHYGAIFCNGGQYKDLVNLIFKTDMNKCRCVVFDTNRCKGGHISYDVLESIKNGMVCNTKYETGVKLFNSPHVIIFANEPPSNPEKLSPDRWVIEKI